MTIKLVALMHECVSDSSLESAILISSVEHLSQLDPMALQGPFSFLWQNAKEVYEG